MQIEFRCMKLLTKDEISETTSRGFNSFFLTFCNKFKENNEDDSIPTCVRCWPRNILNPRQCGQYSLQLTAFFLCHTVHFNNIHCNSKNKGQNPTFKLSNFKSFVLLVKVSFYLGTLVSDQLIVMKVTIFKK